VLFSEKDKLWKIADFGTASQGTSKRLNTTRQLRGTSGYQAPEILNELSPKYNQKSDIFSLGCMIYEIVTGTQLFFENYSIVNYMIKGQLPTTVWWPKYQPSEPNRLDSLERLVASMVAIDPSLRPNAREVGRALKRMCADPDKAISGPKPSDGRPIQVSRYSY
jgi:eukaryotic-like serine/threonine-protein kinase